MAGTKVLLDTGPLVGYLNREDQHHDWAVSCWSSLYDPLWTCESVLSEALCLLQSEGTNPEILYALIERGIVRLGFDVEQHRADIFRLLRKYADTPMSLADASLVRMAELTNDCQVFTSDKDFLHYRRRGRHVIPLLSPF
jgi:predicted nucleic acid-binding protein